MVPETSEKSAIKITHKTYSIKQGTRTNNNPEPSPSAALLAAPPLAALTGGTEWDLTPYVNLWLSNV